MNNVTIQPEPTLEYMIEGSLTDASEYLAGQILPEMPSGTLTGYLGRLADGAARIVATAVKGLAKNVVNFTLDRNASYSIEDHELTNVINASEAERIGDWDLAKQTFGMLLNDMVLKSREHALASNLTNTAVITNNVTLTGDDKWSVATSNVLSRIAVAKSSIAANSQKVANLIVMGRPTFDALQFHPEMIKVLNPGKNTPGLYTAEQMAAAFGVERVLVGNATYNTAKEGQTGSFDYIWGDNLIVAFVEKSAMVRFSRSLGASITCPEKAPKTYAHSYVPEGKKPEQVQVVVVGANWEDKLINTGAAYLIKDTN